MGGDLGEIPWKEAWQAVGTPGPLPSLSRLKALGVDLCIPSAL